MLPLVPLGSFTVSNNGRSWRALHRPIGCKPRDGAHWSTQWRKQLAVWILHCVCFVVHASMAISTKVVAAGKDMRITIVRIAPAWENRGGNYSYTVQPLPESQQIVYADDLTMLFFLISALSHATCSVLFCPFIAHGQLLWRELCSCRCLWRWLEYSMSASIMFVGIAMTVGIRDRNTLIGIFALSFVTMWCGMLTELFSRPNSDEKDGWQKPYYERMLPHFLGFFPYAAAWFIIIQTYKDQLDDMCDELRKKVPRFVDPIVYGSVAVFSSFALVQLVYQKRHSKYYWQTELWYCLLSVRACVHATARPATYRRPAGHALTTGCACARS